MTASQPPRDGDERLWRRVARGEPGPCPPPIELAAWIDGRAEGPAVESIEAHLAACAGCREAAAAARALLEEAGALEFVPAAVLEAARGLVRPARPAAPYRFAGWARAGGWGAVAAASVAVGFAGYRAGSAAPVEPAPREQLLGEMTFGVFAPLETDAPGALLLAGEVSP